MTGRRLPPVDGRLLPWSEIKDSRKWTGLLVGNGASRAVWEKFAYASLYDRASAGPGSHALRTEDRALFERFNTSNFEGILSALRNAELVCGTLAIDTAPIRSRYKSIKFSLIETIRSIHVPWGSVPNSTLDELRSAMLNHYFVFSTNYDLLLYWALMSGPSGDFRDYFWNWRDFEDGERWMVFDPEDTDASPSATKLLYLHGALHLAEMPWGESAKMTADSGGNLLQKFFLPPEDEPYEIVPLFITEGDSRDKLEAIHRSDYLTFAFNTFSTHQGPIVVFGQGLGPGDDHLVKAMNAVDNRPIAFSVLPEGEVRIIERKLAVHKLLPNSQVEFFDATTHPLGSPQLRIQSDADFAL